VRAEEGPSSACDSVSVPKQDVEGAEFASEGLAASSLSMCLSETESYKSLDHFGQVLILQPAASHKIINWTWLKTGLDDN